MTLAEQIRPLLAARDPSAVEGAADIATGYLGQWRAVNDRLGRCADFLRRGLRSEAVHLAECHPNLLQAARDLQTPESSQWERICTTLGLAKPEEPNPETLEDLEQACETEQSLASLLSLHRTLSIGRAPLRQRLAVLYALAERDPATASWQEDLRTLEAERFRRLEREYKTAIRDSDLPTLEALGDEVTQTPWRTPVPRELFARIQKSAQAGRRDARIAELGRLIPQLVAARDAGDPAACAKHLDAWHAMTTPAEARQLNIPDDILAAGTQAAQGASTWLTGQKRLKLEADRASERTPGGAGQFFRKPAVKRTLLVCAVLLLAVFLVVSVVGWVAPEKLHSLFAKPAPLPGAVGAR